MKRSAGTRDCLEGWFVVSIRLGGSIAGSVTCNGLECSVHVAQEHRHHRSLVSAVCSESLSLSTVDHKASGPTDVKVKQIGNVP
jgi:hypothetical protein